MVGAQRCCRAWQATLRRQSACCTPWHPRYFSHLMPVSHSSNAVPKSHPATHSNKVGARFKKDALVKRHTETYHVFCTTRIVA